MFVLSTALAFLVCSYSSSAQLIINVKNQGGDTLQETLAANITEDTVALEFLKPDGTLVTQFLDFQNEVQIFRVILMTEEEQAAFLVGSSLPQYQIFCFLQRLSRNDFIAADAIAKLRQKNPNAIRIPEEDRGKETSVYEYSLSLEKSDSVSRHISNLCGVSGTKIYAREKDIQFWASIRNPDEAAAVLGSVQHLEPSVNQNGRCKDSSIGASCKCQFQFCIPWFPCGLKFCRGHDSTGKALSYRCGIKTCKKCLAFEFLVSQKEECLWDF